MLRGNYHFNSKLQNSYNKYGEDSFKAEVLTETTNLLEVEQDYLDRYECALNLMLEAKRSVITKETAEKISKTLTGRKGIGQTVYVYNRITGSFIREFESKKECVKELGVSWEYINASIAGKNVTKYPYIILDKRQERILPRLSKSEKKRTSSKVYFVGGKCFKSISEAAKAFNINDRTLRRWLRHNNKKLQLLYGKQSSSVS